MVIQYHKCRTSYSLHSHSSKVIQLTCHLLVWKALTQILLLPHWGRKKQKLSLGESDERNRLALMRRAVLNRIACIGAMELLQQEVA